MSCGRRCGAPAPAPAPAPCIDRCRKSGRLTAADGLVQAKPEVDQHRAAPAGHDDVFGLHVAMDRGARVRMRERVGDLRDDPDRLRQSDASLAATGAGSGLRDSRRRREIEPSCTPTSCTVTIRVPQLCEAPRLGVEALDVDLGRPGAGVEDLDGYGTPQITILGKEDLAVSSGAKRAFNDVSAESLRRLAALSGCGRGGSVDRPTCTVSLSGRGFDWSSATGYPPRKKSRANSVHGLIVEEDDQERHDVKSRYPEPADLRPAPAPSPAAASQNQPPARRHR